MTSKTRTKALKFQKAKNEKFWTKVDFYLIIVPILPIVQIGTMFNNKQLSLKFAIAIMRDSKIQKQKERSITLRSL